MNARSRYSVLDLVRGLTLISMIAYHGTYDLVYLFSIKIPCSMGNRGICGSRASAGHLSFCPACAFHWAAIL